jgi:hypothetical protein
MSGRRGTWVAIASLGFLVVGCGGTPAGGGGSSGAKGAMRAACYPPCLATLVARCPLVSACKANLEPEDIGLLGESRGVAACFSSGEREREATDDFGFSDVYVKSPDGKECYAAVGDQSPGVETWDLSVGGQLFGQLTWNLSSGAVAVSCDGTTTEIDISKPLCAGLPWQNTTSCDDGQNCSFGSIPAPGAWDAGTPCDPTVCTTPPAHACEQDSTTLRFSVASYDGPATCDNVAGCFYPKLLTRCDHGCYMAQCTGILTGITNVQGSAKNSSGMAVPVQITGGGVPASTVVTVTARTSPRGAASGVKLTYGTCTASTLCIRSSFLVMGLDPSTPAGQTDYDQWTVNVPGQTAGTRLEFDLMATGAGDLSAQSSYASPGVPYSYTSN